MDCCYFLVCFVHLLGFIYSLHSFSLFLHWLCFSLFYVNPPGALSSLGFMFTGEANLSDKSNGLTEVPVLTEGEDTVLSALVPYKVWRQEY